MIAFLSFLFYLSLCYSLIGCTTEIPDPEPGRDISNYESVELLNRKSALEFELQLVRETPESFYLIVDLAQNILILKSGANILRTCTIERYQLDIHSLIETQKLRFSNRIDPHTPEPGNLGLRNRGRKMPIDFMGRLTEGPRLISKLYFTPSFLLQPPDLATPSHVSYAIVSGNDIKALGSALQQGDSAILIPPPRAQTTSGM